MSWEALLEADSRAGVRLGERDVALLSWIGEQYAVTLPQLAWLMGRSLHAAKWQRRRWQRAGWARGAALLQGGPTFMWLLQDGREIARGRFKLWRPSVGRLAHIAAVNEVRLHFAQSAPGSVWLCERTVARDLDRRDHLPDAVVRRDGEQHAIEVELVPKSRSRTEAIVEDLLGRYDAAIYCCARAARSQLMELAAEVGPQLVVRDLPAPSSQTC